MGTDEITACNLQMEKKSLYTIPGMPPTLIDPPKGDAFACRNEYALNIDYEEMPPMFKITDTHYGGNLAVGSKSTADQIIYGRNSA